MGQGALRIAAVGVAAVVVAEVAVWVLSPGGDVPDPLQVSEAAYFSDTELDRAADFRGGQRQITVASLVVEGVVLGVLALWRPSPLRRALSAVSKRPIIGAAAVGAAISLTLVVTGLPLSVLSLERSRDVGLSTQTLGAWSYDVGRSAAIGAIFAGVGAAIAMGMIRRMGNRWWIGGASLVVVFAIVTSWLAPVAIAPLFNDFEDLPPGPVRAGVLELGEKAGVEIGDVYEVDASRRSTALNAYVGGLGSTKQVVIYDNLLRQESLPTIRSVVAHEIGHVDGNDIWRGIGFVAIVAPLGALFVAMTGAAIARGRGDDPRGPAALPGIALALAAASFVIGVAGLQLSRNVEARADAYALELTDDPDSLMELQRSLTVANVGDPDPPGIYSFLFATHPATVERIGAALAAARERGG